MHGYIKYSIYAHAIVFTIKKNIIASSNLQPQVKPERHYTKRYKAGTERQIVHVLVHMKKLKTLISYK